MLLVQLFKAAAKPDRMHNLCCLGLQVLLALTDNWQPTGGADEMVKWAGEASTAARQEGKWRRASL